MTQTGNQSHAVATSRALLRLRSYCGVVACTTLGLWATGGALVGVSLAFRATPVMALIADGGIIFTYLVYLGSAFLFAHHVAVGSFSSFGRRQLHVSSAPDNNGHTHCRRSANCVISLRPPHH